MTGTQPFSSGGNTPQHTTIRATNAPLRGGLADLFSAGEVSNAAASIQLDLGWHTMEELFNGALHNTSFNAKSTPADIARMVYYEARAHHGELAAGVVLRAFAANGVGITEDRSAVQGMVTVDATTRHSLKTAIG